MTDDGFMEWRSREGAVYSMGLKKHVIVVSIIGNAAIWHDVKLGKWPMFHSQNIPRVVFFPESLLVDQHADMVLPKYRIIICPRRVEKELWRVE